MWERVEAMEVARQQDPKVGDIIESKGESPEEGERATEEIV